jgi:hypothetical protein
MKSMSFDRKEYIPSDDSKHTVKGVGEASYQLDSSLPGLIDNLIFQNISGLIFVASKIL